MIPIHTLISNISNLTDCIAKAVYKIPNKIENCTNIIIHDLISETGSELYENENHVLI